MAAGKKISTVSKLLILQALVMFLTVSGFMLLGGWQTALSSGLGSLVALLPNIYCAYRIHLASGKEAKVIVRTFYASETKKILLTAALFVIVFQIRGVNILTLFAGYIAVVSVHWLALIIWRD